MVAVFVRDDDAVEPLDSMAERFQATQRFALAQARVNKNARGLGFNERQIARTSRRQNGYAYADCPPPKILEKTLWR